MVDVPVLTDERTRKNYDRTWSLYPFEHPSAYWLRGGDYGLVCTRCGATEPATVEDEGAVAFVDQHLKCKLGHGVRNAPVSAICGQPSIPSTERGQADPVDDEVDPFFARA